MAREQATFIAPPTQEAAVVNHVLGADLFCVRADVPADEAVERLARILYFASELMDVAQTNARGDEQAEHAVNTGAGVLVGLAEALARSMKEGLGDVPVRCAA